MFLCTFHSWGTSSTNQSFLDLSVCPGASCRTGPCRCALLRWVSVNTTLPSKLTFRTIPTSFFFWGTYSPREKNLKCFNSLHKWMGWQKKKTLNRLSRFLKNWSTWKTEKEQPVKERDNLLYAQKFNSCFSHFRSPFPSPSPPSPQPPDSSASAYNELSFHMNLGS